MKLIVFLICLLFVSGCTARNIHSTDYEKRQKILLELKKQQCRKQNVHSLF